MNKLIGILSVLTLAACGAPAPESMDLSTLQAIAETCTGGDCPDKTDTEVGQGKGSAISTTSTGALALATANAEADARTKARAKVKVDDCDTGCKPLGEVSLTAAAIAGTLRCNPVRRTPAPGEPDVWPPATGTSTTPGDGIGDWWQYSCGQMAGRTMGEFCNDPALAGAKPFYTDCQVWARATGTRVCIDEACTCAAMGLDDSTACHEAEVAAQAELTTSAAQLGD